MLSRLYADFGFKLQARGSSEKFITLSTASVFL
ncbi:hypothetical protein F383_02400 [Gossypium arboreum]|uniref:Uncharacterized protein n=1 Tax=Gossypium arboreum TaxID=29729 RepID=A0A0B0NGQ4_GOSAR|nr:hypothetical protein F383_02400 [Gossypium arboreum]